MRALINLPVEEAQRLRAEVAGRLKSSKTPKSNISKEERVAPNKLRKSKDLLIMGADKGKCTMVQSSAEYEKKVMTMLNDKHTYENLSKNPTPLYKRKLVEILKRLKVEEKINESQYSLLFPTAENKPRMYCTTKIHRAGNPIRPIVDYIGCIGHQTPKALAEILAPMVGTSEHHVVNSKTLAEEKVGVTVDDGDIFNSHDVVSLLTNTPLINV